MIVRGESVSVSSHSGCNGQNMLSAVTYMTLFRIHRNVQSHCRSTSHELPSHGVAWIAPTKALLHADRNIVQQASLKETNDSDVLRLTRRDR